ncbi:MAG: thioredoxin domain-containing protein [Candidatus Paceibacterota bacterium]|jgi:protein-disulfide isomerase
MEDNKPKSSISLPGAIIIAGAIIAVAIIWVKKPVTNVPIDDSANQKKEVNIKTITANDHILGNPNAPVKIIEYSDTACPYCKVFNGTMVKIMDKYGATGQVVWIYRHFPLDKPNSDGFVLHKNAGNEAHALECAASVGDNAKFWEYEKLLYERTPSVTQATPEGLDQNELAKIAVEIGLDAGDFGECMASGKHRARIDADYNDALKSGITGTPYSIIITPSDTKIPLVGAQSYEMISTAIEALIKETI